MIRRLRILAALSALLLGVLGTQAQDTARQESRRAALQKEIAQLERQIKENASKSQNALNELTLVRKQIETRRSLVQESAREIRQLDDTIAVRQEETERLRQRLETMEQYYRRLVRNAYKNRDARVWYSYLLSSKDLGQASRRYTYLRDLSRQMNSQAGKIREVRAGIEEEISRLAALRQEADAIRQEHERELQGLRKEELRSDELVTSLKKDKNLYQRQLENKRKQVEALNREIERIIAQAIEEARRKEEEARKNNRTVIKDTAPIDYKLSEDFAANKGKLPWPADGPVVETFGRHNHPVYTTLVMPANNGVNIGVSHDAQVRAVFNGEVKHVIVMPGYGRCVLVQHGSYFTFYCKLASVSVKAVQKITTGQVLGRIDTISGETQLHFQLWKNTDPQDPEQWLVR